MEGWSVCRLLVRSYKYAVKAVSLSNKRWTMGG